MSHDATNWAIQRRGLKPTTKIVLWHLCDRFNPDFGCFPSQDRLAHDCEISRSTLNEHHAQLEATGLLRRVPRLDPVTKRQLPTRYILGFEPGLHRLMWFRVRKSDMEIGPLATALKPHRNMTPPTPFRLSRVRKSHTAIQRKPCPEFALSRVRKMAKAVSGIRTLTL